MTWIKHHQRIHTDKQQTYERMSLTICHYGIFLVAQLVKNPQCGKPGFDPWVWKIPWRREQLPTPVFWPRDTVHGITKNQTWLSDSLLLHTKEGASLVAQTVKNPPAMQETWYWSLSWEDPLEKGMATYSTILAWRSPTDWGACQATVHKVAKSRTWLSS